MKRQGLCTSQKNPKISPLPRFGIRRVSKKFGLNWISRNGVLVICPLSRVPASVFGLQRKWIKTCSNEFEFNGRSVGNAKICNSLNYEYFPRLLSKSNKIGIGADILTVNSEIGNIGVEYEIFLGGSSRNG